MTESAPAQKPMLYWLLKTMRPTQWTKNAVVFAAFVFAFGDIHQELGLSHLLYVALAAACFCGMSSCIYLINDSLDQELDRNHPTKKYRPIAAGHLPVKIALIAAGVLAVTCLVGAYLLAPRFFFALLAYLVLQIGYTCGLKKLAVVDVLCIATGFLLRAVGGAVVIDVSISSWLLVCTFLLALFLGFSKRRHEKVNMEESTGETRPSLMNYSEKMLDAMIMLVAGATLTAYTLYTISPETVEKFGSRKLVFTVPFVLLGLWRYFHIVYKKQEGGRPEKILLTDPMTILIVLGYGVTVLGMFLL